MEKFNYKTINKDTGETYTGNILADSMEIARSQLVKQDRLLVDLHAARQSKLSLDIGEFFAIPRKIFMQFFFDLSIMLKAHIPIINCFSLIHTKTKNIRLKSMLDYMIHQINAGSSVSEAIRSFSDIFSNFVISLISVGEQTGDLSAVLNDIYDREKKNDEVQKKIRAAIAYPAILAVVTVLVLAMMMLFVFPPLIEALSAEDIELPALSAAIFNTSIFLQKNWLIVLLVIFTSVGGFFYFLRKNYVRVFIDSLLVKIPLMQSISKAQAFLAFSKNMHILLKNKILLFDAVKISLNSLNNQFIKAKLQKMVDLLEGGENFADSIKKTEFFPSFLVEMVEAGEAAGNLETVFHDLNDYYELQFEDITNRFTALLSPILILIAGSVIGVIIVAVYLPILSMASSGDLAG